MIFKSVVLLVLVSVFSIGVADNIKRLPELDDDLRKHIQKASLQEANNFNNIVHANFETIWSTIRFSNGKFDDAILELGGEKFFLIELEIIGTPTPYFTHAVPDFLNGNMASELYWENVVVEGSFERYFGSDVSNIGISSGKIRIIWDKISARGNIAIMPDIDADFFHSTNYDLDMNSENIAFHFDNSVKQESVFVSSDQLKFHLEKDLLWKLQNSLPDSVDSFLQTLPLTKMFSGDKSIAKNYTNYMQVANDIINRFADEMIRMIKDGVAESGFWKFKLPDIRENFSKKFLFITYWGHFDLWNGEAQDIRTLRRRKNFSMTINNGTYDIAGEVELGQLSAKYGNYRAKIWNIGPSGSVSVTTSNAFSFKIKAVTDSRSLFGFRVTDYSLKAHINNIKINATGLGILDWLLSLIATCVANSFKGDISVLIEHNIIQAMDSIVQLIP